MKRAGAQRERDGGDSFLDTTDSSIEQEYRKAFCALKHTRSSYKQAICHVDSGLSFDSSSEVCGGEDLALAAGASRARGTWRYIYNSSFRVFLLLETSFHAFICWMFCSFVMILVFDTALSDGK